MCFPSDVLCKRFEQQYGLILCEIVSVLEKKIEGEMVEVVPLRIVVVIGAMWMVSMPIVKIIIVSLNLERDITVMKYAKEVIF